jgi:hypothetical protein
MLILLELIILVAFGQKCTFWISSLCISLRPPINSSLLGSNIHLSTLFSNTLSLQVCSPLMS